MSVHHFWGIKFLNAQAGTGAQNAETVMLNSFFIVTVLGGDIR